MGKLQDGSWSFTARRKKRELTDDALRAVQLALNRPKSTTRVSTADRRETKRRSFSCRAIGRRLRFPIRHVDAEFADACEHKSRYWLNPDSWDKKKVARYKIRLTSVAKKVREISRIPMVRFSIAKKKNA